MPAGASSFSLAAQAGNSRAAHSAGIVHRDIKPENIMMKSDDFKEFTIIDLGLANMSGKDFLGTTPGYQPPETNSSKNKGRILGFKNDVFSLGMTFAELEGDFIDFKTVDKECSKSREDKTNCQRLISLGLQNEKKNKKGLLSLLPAIEKATEAYKANRFETMTAFSDKMIEVFKTFKGSEPIIQNLNDIAQKESENFRFPGYWRNAIVLKKEKAKKEERSEGILDKIIRFFTCGNNNPKKNKKTIIANPYKNVVNGVNKKKIIL